ncbi:FxsA family protein [Caviibacterium pharyngocola]|uniref:Membrane protein FxsA n=1 Tax=Caviibacterium pharyngocola TaxID=28159 RepID=A0A2M8RY91_9PAST|nr:FxsA family protein [Caviibacterium pharyngocola]PJG83860.1 membrane protein FxsA [Caviibacterium pharyngocola]
MPLILCAMSAFLFIYFELSLLVWIGTQLGVLGLILLLILSAVIGVFIIRLRGWYTLINVRKQLAEGDIPTQSLLRSGLWIFAGVLFLLPGFLSDLLALLLLTPFGEKFISGFIARKFALFGSTFVFKNHRTFNGAQTSDETIFDAEFERQADEDKRIK